MFDFQEGEVLLIDKPLDWTSFQVVNKIRYAIRQKLGVKKIKVGHAGTLDPLATGLLILCTGKKTKTIDQIQAQEKEYTGIIKLGSTTPSFDLETEIDKTFDTSALTEELIKEAAQRLTGDLEQIPPSFSAKKIKGQRAYDLARKGEMVEIPPKPVKVYEFDANCADLLNIDSRIRCSKGTYIRSLARDLGLETNTGGHLTKLRRTKIGDFDVNDALSIEQMIEVINQG